MPALLHSTSSRPKWATVSATHCSTAASSDTSSSRCSTSVCSGSCCSVSVRPSALRSTSIRRAPSLARRLAVARPMPLPAPVISTILFSKRCILISCYCSAAGSVVDARLACWNVIPVVGIDAKPVGQLIGIDMPGVGDAAFEAYRREGDQTVAQSTDIGFPPDDAFALAFEAKPVVGDAAGVLATLDLHAADAAALRPTDGYPTHILRRQGREVDVHGAILRPAPFQQFAHQLRAVLPGGFPVNRIGGVVGLTQGNGRNAQQGAGKGTADRAGVGHRVADIGSAIDTGQNQIRLGRQQLGDTEQDAVTGRAADAEAALLELVNPQRMVYRNGHGDATLIQVGGDLLQRAIIDNPPAVIRDGGVIREGYDSELDDLQNISENAGQYLIDLENRERERTGLSTLKVGYNRVHGYYIELSRGQSAQAPADYIRRQTLKGAERFITPELKEFEDKALSARSRALAREKQLYDELLDRLNEDLAALQDSAAALAQLDVLSCLAERAVTLDYCRPEFVEGSGQLCIEQGRHPVVEKVLDGPFVANDLELTPETRMLVITGPNMGGKSTYMRQTALIVLLAHIGSHVPAARVVLSPMDRIFTRIGSSDDLAGGRSTFMVEMSETANILHNATDASLVLMDEVGRGTSTFDGLSLAWAAAEYLAGLRAFTLFATHYFELTALADSDPGVANVHLNATEHNERIVFLHNVLPGPASQSYGLQVAQLAGVPRPVIERARQHLATLEQQSLDQGSRGAQVQPVQPDLFAAAPHPAAEALHQLSPDDMSPRQALELLYEWKKRWG